MDTRPVTTVAASNPALPVTLLPAEGEPLITEELLPILPLDNAAALEPENEGSDLPPMLPSITADAAAEAVLEALLAGRDVSTELEAAAAGLGGIAGSEEAGHDFLRLGRVSESTTPVGYIFPTGEGVLPLVEDQRVLLPDNPADIFGLTPSIIGGELPVDESGLPDGSIDNDEGTTGSGSFFISAPDGVQSLTVTLNGVTVISNGVFTPQQDIPTEFGELDITGFNPATGEVSYTYTLIQNADHPDVESDPDNSEIPNSVFDHITVVLTDTDGDTDTDVISIQIIDDTPIVLNKTDLLFSNASNPAPGGTGYFDYTIGADGPHTYADAANSDFSAITLTGDVGGAMIEDATVSWVSESATQAVFTIQFNYLANPDNPLTMTTATGTLTFNKADGTYAVQLNEPIESFNIVTTGQALSFTGYTPGTSTEDHTQPEVSVAQLSNDFFVQFTGYSEPGGGTGSNNLQAGTTDANAFANGELFSQAAGWVSTSHSENGVNGDTLQRGEVLDMDFFTDNPTGDTSLTPTALASAIFLKFDGFGSEDLVVILKLVDPDTGIRTTKAIVIDNADIYQLGDVLPTGYNITLDNNDGAVIIESNDYNNVGADTGENWLIEGAQILVSTEGITGEGINLNSDGASTTLQAFGADTTDSDVLKISDIGFVTVTSDTEDASLSFTFSVGDADGDATSTQILDVAIVGGTTFTGSADAETLQGSAGDDTLTGGGGADAFVWQLGDGGTAGSPTTDTITDFNTGDDQLDLRDLLVGENGSNLTDYLHFASDGTTTEISISSTGAFDGSNYASAADQKIVLSNVDLTGSDSDIINTLISGNNLRVDP